MFVNTYKKIDSDLILKYIKHNVYITFDLCTNQVEQIILRKFLNMNYYQKIKQTLFLSAVFFMALSCKKEEITPSNILSEKVQPVDSIPVITGQISGIMCDDPLLIGQIIVGQPAESAELHVQYNGGNGYDYPAQTIPSTGVSGLSLQLQKGYFSTQRSGILKFKVTGKATSTGVAAFAIALGGQHGTLRIEVLENLVRTSGYGPNFIDIDGNVYKSVYIGNQLWQAENLKTTKFNDGTVIPEVENQKDWFKNFSTNISQPMLSTYNNDHSFVSKNGMLYNWYVIDAATNGSKNVCPRGWHVPTDTEWSVLEEYLGGAERAGGKMKEVGSLDWVNPNTSATNESLLSALPSGYRLYNGNYAYMGNYGFYWTATENGTSHAYFRYLYNETSRIIKNSIYKSSGFSIRCLKD